MDIYIDAALNKKRTLVSSLNDIKIPDSITNLIHSESQSVRTSTSEKKLKKIQLLFGVIALISTFFPWLSYSYSASFMGTETGSAITLSAWHSGLGFIIFLWISIGIVMLLLNKKYWWSLGVIAILTSWYFIFSIISTNVNLDYGSYGNAKARYNIAIGYYIFFLSSIIFSLGGLLSLIVKKFLNSSSITPS